MYYCKQDHDLVGLGKAEPVVVTQFQERLILPLLAPFLVQTENTRGVADQRRGREKARQTCS
jgi:hypothetical protein